MYLMCEKVENRYVNQSSECKFEHGEFIQMILNKAVMNFD